MATNRVYELMYIAAPNTAEDALTALNDTIEKVATGEGATILKKEDMGVRKLAYPIKKMTDGRYFLYEISGSGKEIAEIERRMRVNDLVVRYLTVRVDEERKAADKLRKKREDRAAKRAAGMSAADGEGEE